MNTVKTEIVKVQRPIATNDPNIPWLVYAKGHKKTQQVRQAYITEQTKKAMGKDLKAYFNAEWNDVSGWTIKDRVEDQEW